MSPGQTSPVFENWLSTVHTVENITIKIPATFNTSISISSLRSKWPLDSAEHISDCSALIFAIENTDLKEKL